MSKPDVIQLRGGLRMPKLGMGTWEMGGRRECRRDELAALRAGLDAGITMIDTAEMYGRGAAETLVGEAVSGYDRSRLFIVSKVLPQNAGRKRLRRSLEASLRRLRTDYLDLYLYHWQGSIPFAETIACLTEAQTAGLIRSFGVSNLDLVPLQSFCAVPDGERCCVNQLLYHLGSRGIEWQLLPWMRSHQIAGMAYCPLAQGGSLRRGLCEDATVRRLATARGVTVMQLLLAFVLSRDDMAAIPKSADVAHTLENAAAREIELTVAELTALDQAFPPPQRKLPLDMA